MRCMCSVIIVSMVKNIHMFSWTEDKTAKSLRMEVYEHVNKQTAVRERLMETAQSPEQ